MTRLTLLAAALACAALAVGLAPSAPVGDADALSALGRSMGGVRVAIVDLLFLRAERLRREGKVEDLPALYEAVRKLDPDNAAAAEHLAYTYAYDLLADAPDAEAKLGWWQAAWDLIETARRAHPRDASLLNLSSDLLLKVAPAHDLQDAVARTHGDPNLLGIERLVAAAVLTEVLPRRGRSHLLRIALGLPVVAALQLERETQDISIHVRALGREVLKRRGAALARMPFDVEGEAGVGTARTTLDVVLTEGLRTVDEVRAALEDGRPADARAALARYRRRLPSTVLGDVLDGVIRRAGG